MKKLSLLALSLISSAAGLYAKDEAAKPHTCTVIARGGSSTKPKLLFDFMTLAAVSRFDLPTSLLVALFPFVNDLTEYEVNEFLNDETYALTHPNHVKLVSHLTNGWNIISGSLAAYLTAYLCYTGTSRRDLTDGENKTIVKAIFAMYTAAQVSAILAKRNATGEDLFALSKKREMTLSY